MSENKPLNATVQYVRDANVGDWIWVWNGNAAVYDDAGKFLGRGSYRIAEVMQVNRRSLVAFGVKFDRTTGSELETRGYAATYHAAGVQEKIDREILSRKREVASRVHAVNDANVLRRIIAILDESSQ